MQSYPKDSGGWKAPRGKNQSAACKVTNDVPRQGYGKKQAKSKDNGLASHTYCFTNANNI